MEGGCFDIHKSSAVFDSILCHDLSLSDEEYEVVSDYINYCVDSALEKYLTDTFDKECLSSVVEIYVGYRLDLMYLLGNKVSHDYVEEGAIRAEFIGEKCMKAIFSKFKEKMLNDLGSAAPYFFSLSQLFMSYFFVYDSYSDNNPVNSEFLSKDEIEIVKILCSSPNQGSAISAIESLSKRRK